MEGPDIVKDFVSLPSLVPDHAVPSENKEHIPMQAQLAAPSRLWTDAFYFQEGPHQLVHVKFPHVIVISVSKMQCLKYPEEGESAG